MNRRFGISFFTVAIVSVWTFGAHAQIFRLPAPDTLSGNFFGIAVAFDDSIGVVGATGEDSCGPNSGAAYVYELDDAGDWVIAARLEAKDCREGHFFGSAVAIERERILVSSYRTFVNRSISNAVYVFEKGEDGWEQSARLGSPDKDKSGPFASSIAISGDRILITSAGDAAGATINGVGYIYEQNKRGAWKVTAKLSGALSPRAGVMGTSSALDGDRAVIVGSKYSRGGDGILYVFDRDSSDGSWYQTGAIRGIKDFFISVDVSGEYIIVGESKGGVEASGQARILTQVEGNWTTSATLTPTTPYANGGFGGHVSIHGSVALVSGFDEQLELDINVDQVVYVFRLESGRWRQRQILDMGQTAFGSAIDLSDGMAIIGQASEAASGQAYLVRVRRP